MILLDSSKAVCQINFFNLLNLTRINLIRQIYLNFQLVFDKFGGLLIEFCGLHSVKPQFSFFIANKKLSRDFICFKKYNKAKAEKHWYRCNLRNNLERSSLWRSSIKETVLKDFAIFTGKYLC